MDKKPFWKSKIILLGGAMLLIFGGNLLAGGLFRSGVTPEQIQALEDAYPQGAQVVEGLKNGESILNYTGAIFSALIIVARAWFTNTAIFKK